MTILSYNMSKIYSKHEQQNQKPKWNDSCQNAEKQQSIQHPERSPGGPHGLKQKEDKLGNGRHAVQNKQIQQHTMVSRNYWNTLWNARKALIRQTEKGSPKVPNNNDERGEGNGRTVWLEHMLHKAHHPAIFTLTLLWNKWSFVSGSNPRHKAKKAKSLNLDTLLWKGIQREYWTHSESTHFAEV